MHKIIAAAILIALAPVASANDAPESASSTMCATMSSLARSTMKLRQVGGDMAMMYNRASEIESDAIRTLAQSLIVEAFKAPRYSSDQMREREATDFASKVFMECVQSNG